MVYKFHCFYGSLVLCTFLLFVLSPSVLCVRTIVLDNENDLFRSWTLKGSYVYYPNGGLLRQVSANLPKEFNYKAFMTTKGIWAVLPQISDDASTSVTNTSVSFTFTASAQLMTSATLTFCIGGQSRLIVKDNKSKTPFYTVRPSDTPAYEWVQLNIPFPGTSQVNTSNFLAK